MSPPRIVDSPLERRSFVGAMGIDDTQAAGRITESDEALIEHAQLHRRSTGIREIARWQDGKPEPSEQLP